MSYLPETLLLTKALTLQIAGAYTAGDVMGGLLTFTGLSLPGGGATLRRVSIIDDDNEKAALKVWLFRAAPTAIVDADAFAPLIADLKKLVGVVAVAAADYTTINGNAYAIKEGVDISLALPASNSLYVYVVCDATPTYTAATDLYIELLLWTE